MKKYALAIALFMPSYDELLEEVAEEFQEEDFPTETIDEVETEEIAHEAIVETQQEEYTQVNRTVNVVATFYTSKCEGCIGITKTGDDVRNTIYVDGRRVIAVDPRVIPLRSIVKATLANGDTFEAIASDIGGGIKGNRIDVLVASDKEAFGLGRQQATVEIIEEGGE